MLKKRDWIVRMVNIFHKLEIRVLYNGPSVRSILREKCDDSISIPTTQKLLRAILEAQKNGLQFKINDKLRKLVEKKTATNEKWYELIEENKKESIKIL
jgi:hypothetical protein